MIRFRHKYFYSIASFLFCVWFVHVVIYKCTILKCSIDTKEKKLHGNLEKVVVAAVICGHRILQTMVMIKSALIFKFHVLLKFIIFAEFDLQGELTKKLIELQALTDNSFSFEIRNISFPDDKADEWKHLFQLCAAQRLFLPNMLTEEDRILYVDTDVIFLNELSDIWSHFKRMNESHIAALAPEHEDPNIGWYNRFARHPYYGKLGVNSGVMLMDLNKMRLFNWTSYLNPIFQKYKLNLTWGDQDIINIIFSSNPEKLYIYSCRYNYRTDHCMYYSNCKDTMINGVSVLHGSRGAFILKKQPAFKAIFKTFEEYNMVDPISDFITSLADSLEKTKDTNCGLVRSIFTRNIIKLFSKEDHSNQLRNTI